MALTNVLVQPKGGMMSVNETLKVLFPLTERRILPIRIARDPLDNSIHGYASEFVNRHPDTFSNL